VSKRALAAATCVLTGAGLATSGCGGAPGPQPRVQVLTSESVDRYRRGSPEREVIEWWRDVQYGNADGVAERYDLSAQVSVDEIQGQLTATRQTFESIPRVDAVTDEGNVSTVYLIAFPFRRPNDTNAYSLRLRRQGRQWKLTDNSLLERLQAERTGSAAKPPEGSAAKPPEEGASSDAVEERKRRSARERAQARAQREGAQQAPETATPGQ